MPRLIHSKSCKLNLVGVCMTVETFQNLTCSKLGRENQVERSSYSSLVGVDSFRKLKNPLLEKRKPVFELQPPLVQS